MTYKISNSDVNSFCNYTRDCNIIHNSDLMKNHSREAVIPGMYLLMRDILSLKDISKVKNASLDFRKSCSVNNDYFTVLSEIKNQTHVDGYIKRKISENGFSDTQNYTIILDDFSRSIIPKCQQKPEEYSDRIHKITLKKDPISVGNLNDLFNKGVSNSLYLASLSSYLMIESIKNPLSGLEEDFSRSILEEGMIPMYKKINFNFKNINEASTKEVSQYDVLFLDSTQENKLSKLKTIDAYINCYEDDLILTAHLCLGLLPEKIVMRKFLEKLE